MKFSIIIPVYNVENYLHECLDSIIVQTFDDFEVICVDDGSTDSSGEICDAYKKLYPNLISVFHKENAGQISARFIGIQNAHGDYFCFIDSDDFIVPNFLEILHHEIQNNNSDLVIFGYTRVDRSGKFDRDFFPPLTRGRYPLSVMYKVRDVLVLTDKLNNLCFKCIKSDLFDRDICYSRYYSVRNGEDLIQSLPIFDKATLVSVIPNCLYIYRSSPNSITNSRMRVSTIDSWLVMYSVLCEYAEKWGYSESVYRQRFSLIFTTIVKNLIVNRFVRTIYQPQEYILITERLLKDDFQQELLFNNPIRGSNVSIYFKWVLKRQSKGFFLFNIFICGIVYKLIKQFE